MPICHFNTKIVLESGNKQQLILEHESLMGRRFCNLF